MGTNPHNLMAVPIVGKEPKQTLIAIMTSEVARKGILSLNIQMLISIIIILLMMNINQGIKKHVLFLDYITTHLLSARKE